jgi:hypothetical protein
LQDEIDKYLRVEVELREEALAHPL